MDAIVTPRERSAAPKRDQPAAARKRGGSDDGRAPTGNGGSTRTLRERPFALRLQKACDENHRVPAYNHGRQAWVRAQLAERFGVAVSSETISKWFTGVARPRPDKINSLARLLDVDEAWLTLGVAPHMEPRERKIRNAMVDGVVNVLAGFIQMTGGHPAFPEGDDPHAKGGARVDLYAIIKGAHYSFHVVLAQEAGPDAYRFSLAYGHEERIVIGVVQREPLICDFIELKGEMVDRHGARRSGFVEITVDHKGDDYLSDGEAWPRIKSFSERL